VKDAVILGAIDTDMSRGFDIPKVWIESAAVGIFDDRKKGEEVRMETETTQIDNILREEADRRQIIGPMRCKPGQLDALHPGGQSAGY